MADQPPSLALAIRRILLRSTPRLTSLDVPVLEEAADEVERMTRENCELYVAAEMLLERLDDVHAHDDYQAVWQIAQIHRGPYRGPQYIAEMDILRAVLAKVKDGQ